MRRLLALLTGLIYLNVSSAIFCPLYGPSFPAATNLSDSTTIQRALKTLKALIDIGFETESSSSGPVDPTAANAIQIFSTEDTAQPLFEYYRNGNTSSPTGVQDIDGDTVFRIASISKVITAYLILIELGDAHWSTRITDVVPELKGRQKNNDNPIDNVEWEDVTLGALAGQISGVISNLFSFPLPFQQDGTRFGLAPLEWEEMPCRIDLVNGTTCNREETFAALDNRHPIFAPNTKPVYGNIPFMLLGFALESLTGKTYEELVYSALGGPLGLTATTVRAPDDSKGVIPVNGTASWWSVDLGVVTPTGGIYASLNDLSRIGRSILNSTILDANTTRGWLKPTSFTSDLKGAIGRPWEIYRDVDVVPNRGVDIFCKAGDFGSYHTYMCLIPDYNIGFTTAIAGTASHDWLDRLIVETLLPALEAAAKEQADAAYSGTYKTFDGLNTTMTLTIDEDLPGLGVIEWINNGTDVRELFSGLPGGILAGVLAGDVTKESIRILPTNLERYTENGTQIAWRALLTSSLIPEKHGPFSACGSWSSVDAIAYGEYSIDEVLFTLGQDGKAISVSPRVFKTVYEKQAQ
jgi:CubicO group peptidase (beta-lactamase class C family)